MSSWAHWTPMRSPAARDALETLAEDCPVDEGGECTGHPALQEVEVRRALAMARRPLRAVLLRADVFRPVVFFAATTRTSFVPKRNHPQIPPSSPSRNTTEHATRD